MATLCHVFGVHRSSYKYRENRPEKPDGRLMKEPGLVSCQQPAHRYKRGGHEHIAIPNHPERQFAVTETNQVWCGNVRYIWTGKRWAYLAVVLDLFARKPVGRAMSFSPDSRLTMKALEMAWETRGKPAGVMFHSVQAVIIRAGSSGSYCGDTGSDKV
ncbi:transposase InsF for insertion sequence IS3A/B/C/D/E/fA [Salmonella enterica subsp. arizonae]|uniref:Transposase InsF for insertion sequence IS3A/B/C/D/E/fA n=1 Tax=Salmonella enterica subsp. arizonae TaxID=59203 RepID=A0A379SXY1_SALER|nr:transposase InsF for insertion sequence IS3A/B/C/D/E/fA [Salmonella enterica subsp. arizonae]